MDYPNFKTFSLDRLENALPAGILFHTKARTQDIFHAAGHLLDQAGIRGEKATMVQTAILALGLGFTEGYNNSEDESVKLLRRVLPKYGYTLKQILLISGMVLATKRPCSPQNRMEEIVCDAVYDFLGREDYPQWAEKLKMELMHQKLVYTERQWHEYQQNLFEQQRYYTPEAYTLRYKGKLRNFGRIQKIRRPARLQEVN
jgi:hypothetical protein